MSSKDKPMTRRRIYERFRVLREAEFWKEAKWDASFLAEKDRLFFLNEIRKLFIDGDEKESRDLAQFMHSLAEANKKRQTAHVDANIAHGHIPKPRSSS